MKTATESRTAPIDVEARPAQPLATVPPASNGSMAQQFAGKPNLASALVAATRACKPVPHDARNEHHKYDYTSSEAIIEEARAALAANGLCLIPVEQTVNGHEREGADRYELVQQRLLLHVSGESIVCRSAWPITPGAGRPLDKATAAADTLSLSYFLRDLLQMARVNPADEVSARDDSRHKPAPPAPAQPKKPAAAKPLPKNGAELANRIAAKDGELSAAGRIMANDLMDAVFDWGTQNDQSVNVEDWAPACYPALMEFVKRFCADHPASVKTPA